MGRQSQRLSNGDALLAGREQDHDFVQVIARAFDVLRCFNGPDASLGNREISERSGLPRSTISRLTYTLTRIGQLTYLPGDQKYKLGNAAIAMSSTALRGLEFRTVIRTRMQELAEQVTGSVGLTIPDRFQMVYLEYARTYNAVGLHATVGTRISMTLTAAGRAYVAALPPATRSAFLEEIDRQFPEDAKKLRAQLDESVKSLARSGFVIACGEASKHVNGVAVPVWSPRYKTFLVFTVGVLAAIYNSQQLRREIAPRLLEMCEAVKLMAGGLDGGDLFAMSAEGQHDPIMSAIPTRRGRSGIAA